MNLSNDFVVPLDPGEAWKVLLDIKRIMPCVPGAELIEMIDDRTYKGKVSVKLGPVALAFVGTAKFEELAEAAMTAKVLAKGSDAKGRGGANAVVQFRLVPIEAGTKVIVETNLSLSGPVAQYGRGAGVIQGVASQLTAQFAQNLKAMLAHEAIGAVSEPGVPPPAPESAGPEAPIDAAPPASLPISASAADATPCAAAGSPSNVATAATDGIEAAALHAEAAAARIEAAMGRIEGAATRMESTVAALVKVVRLSAPPPQAKPISGFSLMLAVVRNSLAGLLSRKNNV